MSRATGGTAHAAGQSTGDGLSWAGASRAGGARRGARRRSTERDGAHSRKPRGAQVPYLIVVAATAAALVYLWRGGGQGVRGGTLAMAGVLSAAALARLVLPEGRAGMLASRRRIIDVVTLAALAGGLLAAGLLLPTPS